jgi:hypothetical protein
MCGELNRYFIELQPEAGPPVPRWRETEMRRERAAHFIETIGAWLRQEELQDKVAALAITVLGQVQITCEVDIIAQIRHQDAMNIAAIRQGQILKENAGRWNEAR